MKISNKLRKRLARMIEEHVYFKYHSQSNAAEAWGVKPSFVCRVISGDRPPTDAMLRDARIELVAVYKAKLSGTVSLKLVKTTNMQYVLTEEEYSNLTLAQRENVRLKRRLHCRSYVLWLQLIGSLKKSAPRSSDWRRPPPLPEPDFGVGSAG